MRITLPDLSSQFQITETAFSLSSGSITQVSKNDSTRWAYIISNVTTTTAFFGTNTTALTAAGFNIIQGVLPWVIDFDQVGAWVQLPLFATSNPVATTIMLAEIFYRPTATFGG